MSSRASADLRGRRRRLAEARMAAQGLLEPFASPEEAVGRLVCLQGQELRQAVAAIAIRSGGSARDVVDAFDAGRLARGYPMRGTIFVARTADLARFTALTRDRQLAATRRRHEELGIDEAVDDLARAVLADRLAASVERLRAGDVEGVGDGTAGRIADAGGFVSRRTVSQAWQAAGLEPGGGRAYHLLSRLLVRGELCLGPWVGGGQVYVRAAPWRAACAGSTSHDDGTHPGAATEGEEADEPRAKRIADWFAGYVRGHGPVSVRDFCWWTKLPLGEVRRAVEPTLEAFVAWGLDERGETLWTAPDAGRDPGQDAQEAGVSFASTSSRATRRVSSDRVLVLPGFDELYLGYPDRGFLIDAEHEALLSPGGNGVFRPFAVRGGRAVATWATSTADVRRRAGEAEVRVHEFGRPSTRLRRAIERAALAMPYPETAVE